MFCAIHSDFIIHSAREAFIAMYGDIGEGYPEEDWHARFAVFLAGWEEATRQLVPETPKQEND